MVTERGALFPLISYVRFAEANFKEYNFASIVPSSGALPNISFKNVEILSVGGLTICPLGTYYDYEEIACFSDPIKKLVLAIYPA